MSYFLKCYVEVKIFIQFNRNKYNEKTIHIHITITDIDIFDNSYYELLLLNVFYFIL